MVHPILDINGGIEPHGVHRIQDTIESAQLHRAHRILKSKGKLEIKW